MSPNPAFSLVGIQNYSDEEREAVLPIRVSRMPNRRGSGSAHKETIRSVGKGNKLLNQKFSAVKTPLVKLKLKDLEDIVGYEDKRNIKLIEVIQERLLKYNNDGRKAFSEDKPLYKPSKEEIYLPRIRSVKIKAVQKSGIYVRSGIAGNEDIS